MTTVHGVLLSRTRSPATSQTTWQGQRDYSSWCLTESNTEPCNKANNVTVTMWLQFMVSYWVEHGALQQGKQRDRNNVTTVRGVLLSRTRSPATRQTTWQGQRDYSSWCLTESNTEPCNKANNVTGTTWLQFVVSYWVKHGALQQGKQRDRDNVTTVHCVLLSRTRSPATSQTNVTGTTWLQFMVSYWVKHGALQQGKQRDSNNVTTVHGVLLSRTRSPATRQTTW